MFASIYVISIILYVLIGNVESGSDCDSKARVVRARTESGWLRGLRRTAEDGSEYASFRGVPYGKPPVGERRFKELEPVDPWEGDWDAKEDGPACPQKELFYGRMTLYKKGMSEDCMFLNIHVPYKHFSKRTSGKRAGLPILVMIHGGAYDTGSGNSDLHGPEYLMTKDVVVVTFNYRLNVFGFLCLNTPEIPGNQGLRDMVTLLRWVQRNARSFGGDPDNVTLMGQSAGGSSAHLLALSPAAKGLFKKTILMSGTATSNFFTTSPGYANDIAKQFLAYLGINSTDPQDIHRQLVQMPLLDIMRANTLVQNDYVLATFVPVAEKEKYSGVTRILDGSPLELMAKGRGKDYPSLIGYTDKETELIRWVAINANMLRRVVENPSLLVSPTQLYSLTADQIASVTQTVNDKCFNGTKTLDKLLHYFDYLYFKQPAIKVAGWRSRDAPVYLYKYSYRSEWSVIKEALWSVYEGAAHLEDLTYVFRVNSMLGDYVSFPPKNNDDRMKEWMTTMVTNFMRCSNPTCKRNESDWPQVSENKIQYQSIAEPYKYRMSELSAEELDIMQFFDSIDIETRDF